MPISILTYDYYVYFLSYIITSPCALPCDSLKYTVFIHNVALKCLMKPPVLSHVLNVLITNRQVPILIMVGSIVFERNLCALSGKINDTCGREDGTGTRQGY